VADGWNIDKAISTLKKRLTEDDIVICQGGGNFGSLYEFAEIYRGKVFRFLKNARIILMPQTCFYSEDEEGHKVLEDDRRLIADCRDITLFARDEKSLEFMKKNFDANVEFLHDTVSLFEAGSYASDKREGIVVCLRSDKEGTLDVETKKNIIKKCEDRGKVLVTDTCTNYELTPSERKEVLEAKWRLWGSSRLVITDRLHGMIFSLITGTPCIVIGNNHFKVYEAYKTFRENGYIKFIDSMDLLESTMEELLSHEASDYNKKDYGEDVQHLRDILLKGH
jgi:exopolysaccharide biosynthesis predicted pyruvyltransferase EpsI